MRPCACHVLTGGVENFNPRTPCGVRPFVPSSRCFVKNFNPRTPCGVRRGEAGCVKYFNPDFNPRTPCGVRPGFLIVTVRVVKFQSTHPVWGATFIKLHLGLFGFISIHAPRVGCDPRLSTFVYKKIRISIHAPRVGCDPVPVSCPCLPRNFNPRTPCGVRRLVGHCVKILLPISIHAPRVGCDGVGGRRVVGHVISIHAPRVGCDLCR